MHAIIVVCDAFHLGYLGCYGNEWIATPHLDQLAYAGFVFDQCFPNQPRRGASRFSAFTGTSGFIPRGGGGPTSLGARCQAQGVATLFVTDDPAPADPLTPAEFSSFRQIEPAPFPPEQWASLADLERHAEYKVPPVETAGFAAWADRWRRLLGMERRLGAKADRPMERLFSAALDWLADHRRQPSLVWLEPAVSTGAWLAPAEVRLRYLEPGESPGICDPMPGLVGETITKADLPSLRASYAGRISHFDGCMGRFLEGLGELGILDHALIVFTADQGMPLGEHETIGLCRPWPYEERAHVPLLVRCPGCRVAARSPALVQPTDLLPVLADFFSLPPSDGPCHAGANWLPLVRGAAVRLRDYACSGLEDREYAIRTHDWKLILPVEPGSAAALRPRELYSKPEDRWDVHNVAVEHAETADRLELQLRRHLDADRRGTLEYLSDWRTLAER